MRNSYISKINQYVDDITSYISSIADNIDIDLSAYVSKNELNAMSYITSDALNGYATQAYVGSYVVNNTVHIVNITQNEYDALTNEEKNDITKIYNIIDAQNVDVSALVSKTELSGMSYATESYVGSYTSYICNFYNYSGSYTGGINLASQSFQVRLGRNSTSLSDDVLVIGRKVEFDTVKLSEYNNTHTIMLNNNQIYCYNIGNYDGSNFINSSYSLQYVINDNISRISALETAVGQAQQISQEIVDGNNS